MDINFLLDNFVPVIAGIALIIGFLIKNCTPINNKFIPAICAGIGLALMFWKSYIEAAPITPEVVLAGLFSGLAATGLFEALTNIIGKKE